MDEEASDKYFVVSDDPAIQWADRDSRWINGMAERKPFPDSPRRIPPRNRFATKGGSEVPSQCAYASLSGAQGAKPEEVPCATRLAGLIGSCVGYLAIEQLLKQYSLRELAEVALEEYSRMIRTILQQLGQGN